MKLWYIHLFYLCAIAFYAFGFEYIPSQDYPNLLYQAKIFNQIVFHGNTFSGVFTLTPYIPPNAVSTLIIGLGLLAFDIFFFGKIYLFLLGVALYFGIYRYLKSFNIHYHFLLASISFYLTFNLHYIAGYLNFVTGFALALHILASIRNNPKLEKTLWFMGGVMIALYLCHFIALGLFAIFFLIKCLVEKKYRTLILNFAAGIPTILLFLHYLISRAIPTFQTYEETAHTGIIEIFFRQLLAFCRPFIPFQHYKYVTELSDISLALELLFTGVIFLICITLIIRSIVHKNYSIPFWLSLISLLFCLLLPSYIGGVLLPGERFAVFCLINCAILYLTQNPKQVYRKALFIIVFVFGISQIGYTYYNEYRFNTLIASPHLSVDSLLSHPLKHEGSNGFLHFHFYDDIKYGRVVPFSNTGLIAYPDSLNSH